MVRCYATTRDGSLRAVPTPPSSSREKPGFSLKAVMKRNKLKLNRHRKPKKK